MKVDIEIPDGENLLEEKEIEGGLVYLVGYLADKHFVFEDVKIRRVTKDEPWRSTSESTEVVPVLYFSKITGKEKRLIAKRSTDLEYAIFNYRWIP